jgi:peptide/nickel transport system permease protein
MTEVTLPLQVDSGTVAKMRKFSGTFSRIAKYMLVRLIALFITVAAALYLTILIANMGGFVDEIQRGQIQENIQAQFLSNPAFRNISPEVRKQQMEEMVKLQEERLGLNKPFAVRSFIYLRNGLTLNLGRARQMLSDSGSKQVRLIILGRLPSTLLVLGTSNLLLFFIALFGALSLSRNYGSFWDKLVIALTPTSAAPGWFYGIFLILIFSALLRVLPFGGMVDAPPPRNSFEYALSLLKHLILPTAAITLSNLFANAYAWRTYFLIYSSENYVEMAKAKGLSSRAIERGYIMRPTLPTIITTFAFTLIGLLAGAPIFEYIFNWPGLGRVTFQAIGLFDTPVIVGTTVIFGYLLAITVFILDFIYALVDPRVKVGN